MPTPSSERKPLIDPDLLAMLRCPVDGNQLELAPPEVVERINRAIAAGTQRDVADQKVDRPIEGGLRPTGGSIVYPIRGGIPTLVADEALAV